VSLDNPDHTINGLSDHISYQQSAIFHQPCGPRQVFTLQCLGRTETAGFAVSRDLAMDQKIEE
jgi:hypothetical protein